MDIAARFYPVTAGIVSFPRKATVDGIGLRLFESEKQTRSPGSA